MGDTIEIGASTCCAVSLYDQTHAEETLPRERSLRIGELVYPVFQYCAGQFP